MPTDPFGRTPSDPFGRGLVSSPAKDTIATVQVKAHTRKKPQPKPKPVAVTGPAATAYKPPTGPKTSPKPYYKGQKPKTTDL